MMYDGRQYRRNKNLGYREAQHHDGTERDVYVEGGFTTEAGQAINPHHVVIFRVNDARPFRHDGQVWYNSWMVRPDKCIPLCAHTSNNVALGVPTIKSSSSYPVMNIGKHRGIRANPGQAFVEQAHYLVHDGRVYQWTSRRLASD